MTNRRPIKPRERGIALVAVLWLLLLLAVIVGALVQDMRSERHLAASAISRSEARFVAGAAINRAVLSLTDPRDPVQWQLDGTVREIALFGQTIDVSVVSESGKIDLNAAPEQALQELFEGSGLTASEADILADRIIAWRSPVTGVGPNLAAQPYIAAGLSYRPRNGPFRNVGELRLVLGMTDALQASVAPVVTVYSGSADVSRDVAQDAVLRIFAASGDSLASSQEAARADGSSAPARRFPNQGEAVTIRAQIIEDSLNVTRTAVVRFTRDRRQPYWVLGWS